MFRKAVVPLLFLPVLASSLPGASAGAPAPAASAELVPIHVSAAEDEVHAALGHVRFIAAKRSPTFADFEPLRGALAHWEASAMSDLGWACTLRQRLDDAIDDLIARAQQGLLYALHLDELEEQFIDAKLDFALQQLELRATLVGASRADYLAAVAKLVERADAAKSDPAGDLFRQQVASMIELLVDRAAKQQQLVAAEFDALWLELVQARFLRATRILKMRVAFGVASRGDYQRFFEQLVDRARRTAGHAPKPSC